MSKFSGYGIDVVVWEAQLEESRKNKILLTPPKEKPTLEEIATDVVLSLDMDAKSIFSDSRVWEFVYCRYIFYVAAQQYGQYSQVKISRFCKKKHHSTILHGIRTAQDLINLKDEKFLEMWCKYLRNSKMYNKQP